MSEAVGSAICGDAGKGDAAGAAMDGTRWLVSPPRRTQTPVPTKNSERV
jgi:hypothetical protein